MKKYLIYGGIAVAIITILYFVYKNKKKPCPCTKNLTTEQAIDKMTDAELREQITKMGDKRRLDSLSREELKQILLELTKTN